MKNKEYNLRNLTPQSMECVIGSCNAIYDLTPKSLECGATVLCPSIHGTDEGHYLIIGERVQPEEFGLARKVGKNEVLIKVPKKLIDEKGK